MPEPKTMFDRIWDDHLVRSYPDGTDLLYIDRHLLHEVMSPQAFQGLHDTGRHVRRPEATFAVSDHNVPTLPEHRFEIPNAASRLQVETMAANAREHGIDYFGLGDERQGIIHVVAPEQGLILPGMTVVCGDSHTSTHGAFGAIAFGIGTSEIEHVLATQTLRQKKPRQMRISLSGHLPDWVTEKDVALAVIAQISTAGATGHMIEYAGDTVSRMSLSGRMTLCNMAIESGARCGLIAPDRKVFEYLKSRPRLASNPEALEAAMDSWSHLASDPEARFDNAVALDVTELEPMVTWGTSPEHTIPITGRIPHSAGTERALSYTGLSAGQSLDDLPIDTVFIGSCTNGRIEDLRLAAEIVRGRHVSDKVRALVVPGSGLVRAQAEREGLSEIFVRAGFEWREAGCSMCLGMNEDRLSPGERCASTSNRNFEGRQGPGGITHLMSPAMAAAAAIEGRVTDVRRLMGARS